MSLAKLQSMVELTKQTQQMLTEHEALYAESRKAIVGKAIKKIRDHFQKLVDSLPDGKHFEIDFNNLFPDTCVTIELCKQGRCWSNGPNSGTTKYDTINRAHFVYNSKSAYCKRYYDLIEKDPKDEWRSEIGFAPFIVDSLVENFDFIINTIEEHIYNELRSDITKNQVHMINRNTSLTNLENFIG